jgi:hypothetical protein
MGDATSVWNREGEMGFAQLRKLLREGRSGYRIRWRNFMGSARVSVLVAASRCDDLSKCDLPLESSRTGKSAMARTPLPARETRALPLLLQLAEPTQSNGSLRVIDFMAATESPDSNSVKTGSLD